MSSHDLVAGLIAWLVAATFIWAVVAKLNALNDFRALTAAVAPSWTPHPASVAPAVVLALEALAAVLLLTAPRAGAGMGIALLVAFSAIAEGVRRSGARVRCACFGSGGGLLGRETAIRNLVLAAALSLVLVAPPAASALHDFRIVAAASTLLIAFQTLLSGIGMARVIERGLFSS